MSDQNERSKDCDDCEDNREDDGFLLAMMEIFSFSNSAAAVSESAAIPPQQFLVQDRAFTPPGRTTFNRQALLRDSSAPQADLPSPTYRMDRTKNAVIEDPVAA